MPAAISLFGLTFHLYGFLIGLAVIVAASLSEQVFKKEVKTGDFWQAAGWIIGFGLVGARVWHLLTDWQFYQSDLLATIQVWRGGMSIIGALIGGLVGALAAVRRHKGQYHFFQLTDAIVLGLPFGQAVGRLGNWVNQELYGVPTDLPWKIYIDLTHRLLGFEAQAYYHPLFAYEALFLIILGGVLWFGYRQKKWLVGTGRLTLVYLISYSWGRFLLEFIRIDKALVPGTNWGVNQFVMAALAAVLSLVIFKTRKNKNVF